MNTCATCGPTCMPLIKDLCAMCFAKANKAAMTKREKNDEIYRTIKSGIIAPGRVKMNNPKMAIPGRGMKFYATRKRRG